MTINYLNTDVQGFLQKPLNYKTIEETITFENKNITLTPTELSILDIFFTAARQSHRTR